MAKTWKRCALKSKSEKKRKGVGFANSEMRLSSRDLIRALSHKISWSKSCKERHRLVSLLQARVRMKVLVRQAKEAWQNEKWQLEEMLTKLAVLLNYPCSQTLRFAPKQPSRSSSNREIWIKALKVVGSQLLKLASSRRSWKRLTRLWKILLQKKS